MKILLFTENLRAGGKERRICELLRVLQNDDRFQFEVVLTRENIHYKNFLQSGIPYHIIERKWIKKDPRLFFLFFKAVRLIKPDLIHVWGHMPAVYALPAKFLLGIPMINNEIADAAPGKFLIAKQLVFKCSDRIISNTLAGLKSYGAPESKSRVIYNGFDFSRLENLRPIVEIKKNLKIKTPYLIGMVASFLINKDHHTFIQAAIQLLRIRTDISFICIGDGDSTAWKNMIPLELKNFILFPGKQSAVEQTMNACNVGVLTTNVMAHGEGISNALLEFMALGKPVIATDFGGTRELIENQSNGFLIPAFDTESLKEKILYLIDHPEKSFRLGRSARKTVETRFSIKKMTQEFIEEYLRFYPAKELMQYENSDDRIPAA